MVEELVIDGAVSLEIQEDGEVDLDVMVDGDPGTFMPVYPPAYAGATTVTPTEQTQTLATEGLMLSEDVTIEAIPSQYIVPTGTKQITANDEYNVTEYATVDVLIPDPALQTKSVTPTESAQEITPDNDYYGLAEVDVAAISSTYVGSGISRRSGSDLSASGRTVTVPEGYYDQSATKSVTQGSAGTPTASKGTVSGNKVTITPSVTNSTGYITGGTKNGTGVEVKASELVSGTKSISANGTGIDVTNYAAVDVAVPAPAPSLQDKTKTYTPTTSNQSETISADSGYDGLGEVSVTVNKIPSQYIVPSGTKSITANGTGIDVKAYEYADVAVPSGSPNLQTKSKTYTPTTSQQTEDVTPDTGYDGLSKVTVKVNAMPSGSVTAPASISGSSATVSTGTNTLTLTKTVSVTPSVTTAGYVSSGTPGNSSVSLSASVNTRSSSDLSASGATVTAPAGYYANAASKSVASGTAGTPTATKSTVSNHSVSVTPSVTNSTGYITGSTKTGTAVTVSASELVSGSETKTENGTYDVTNLAELVVSVSGGGSSKNAQVVQGTTRTTSSTATAIGAEMTVAKTGTYDVYWSAFRSNTSASYTYGTQLYVAGAAYGSENTTWSNHVQNNHLSNVSLTANQKIRVYGRNSRGSSYYIYAPTLVIIES